MNPLALLRSASSGTAARRHRRGANVVEFALTMPAFLFIVLGIMDYGYLFSIQAGIDNAVSLGCREGAKIDPARGSPATTAQSKITTRATYFCGGSCSVNASVLTSGAYVLPNQTLQCTINRNALQPLTGFVPYPSSLKSTSYYRLEWQRVAPN